MKVGKVKWYKPENDFGFITPDEQPSGDVFIRPSLRTAEINALLSEGVRVSYDEEYTEGGKTFAVNLKVL